MSNKLLLLISIICKNTIIEVLLDTTTDKFRDAGGDSTFLMEPESLDASRTILEETVDVDLYFDGHFEECVVAKQTSLDVMHITAK